MDNPDTVNEPIKSISSKVSNKTQKICKNLLNLKNYEKSSKSRIGKKSEDNKSIENKERVIQASGSKNGSF